MKENIVRQKILTLSLSLLNLNLLVMYLGYCQVRAERKRDETHTNLSRPVVKE